MMAKQVRAVTGKLPLGMAMVVLGLLGVLLWLGFPQNPSPSAAQGPERRQGGQNVPDPGLPALPLAQGYDRRGELELDVKSDYSRIRIRRTDNVRTLWFVRDSGEEVVESRVDMERPYDLLVDYTRFMFLSYLFRPAQEKVLIVGLGGGAMVHFLRHYDPKVHTEVVEIDPVIVKIADRYFGARTGEGVNIVTADGMEHLKATQLRYDVIYMDAFLKPSRSTDETGVPLRLKTLQFYKDVQKKLTPEGLVVFNINPHSKMDEDVRTIRDAFPQTYVFRLPQEGGYVVVGSMSEQRLSRNALLTRAGELDRRFRTSYSFRNMAGRLAW
jgi:spermidine synthase